MIQAQHLVKRFGAFTAVYDVTLQVEPGEILALLGPNGAGKTTTVRMLASLLLPSEGVATIAGYDSVRDAAQVRRVVGLLTEIPGLYSRMSAEDYLDFFGQLSRLSSQERSDRARHLLTYFGVWPDRQRSIGSYSKGMRQKVALARALIHDPQVVLLDEPTSAMDPASAKAVRDYIRGLQAAGRAIMLCTHNLAEAEALADRIAIIKRGRIVAHGASAELKRQLLGAPLYEVRLARPVGGELFSLDGLLQVDAWDETWVRYRTACPEQANPAFVQHLVSAGAEVVSVSQLPQSLEALYLHMVGEESP
ncbi:MAG: ABC transporter ATP-binding protein [Chloroflexi bacterium]|nr:ABC transporter ATP-binding protein [Chloroflexota bacterium]